jgi:predicted TIM-barrel fold metal-dependent hydrolase
VAEIKRCVAAGAVLMKWLPPVQGFDPSDEICMPFYDALVRHNLPLLCHTGGEQSLPSIDRRFADPTLLIPALDRGVTVIMAHCGTRSRPFERSYLPEFVDLVKIYPNCYGDTSALNLPTRSYAYDTILSDPIVRNKLIHGSDWPILPIPPISKIGFRKTRDALHEMNWIQRDIEIKKSLGFDDAYWRRTASILASAKKIPT